MQRVGEPRHSFCREQRKHSREIGAVLWPSAHGFVKQLDLNGRCLRVPRARRSEEPSIAGHACRPTSVHLRAKAGCRIPTGRRTSSRPHLRTSFRQNLSGGGVPTIIKNERSEQTGCRRQHAKGKSAKNTRSSSGVCPAQRPYRRVNSASLGSFVRPVEDRCAARRCRVTDPLTVNIEDFAGQQHLGHSALLSLSRYQVTVGTTTSQYSPGPRLSGLSLVKADPDHGHRRPR